MTDTWASGRVALVTGATSGFGEAMARRLLSGRRPRHRHRAPG